LNAISLTNQSKEESFSASFISRNLTYSDASLEDFWQAEWGGDILFAHGSKHSRGVMILFRPSLCKGVLNVSTDKNGRFLIVNASIDDEFCFVNI